MAYRLFTIALVALVVGAGYWWYTLVLHPLFFSDTDRLRLHFLDVGQGDAILIETPSGSQILVDAGRGIEIINALDDVLSNHDRDIDVAVMTHPDADHIGGFVPVFKRYEVGTVIRSPTDLETQPFSTVKRAITDERAVEHTVSRAYSFSVDGVEIAILWPIGTGVTETNASSVVLLIAYGNTKILLTGDVPSHVEDFLVDAFPEKISDVDVLKASHHGSNTSTSQKFLNHTKPNIIVYSAGANNVYGHPHVDVLERVAQYRARHPSEHLVEYKTMDGTVSLCATTVGVFEC